MDGARKINGEFLAFSSFTGAKALSKKSSFESKRIKKGRKKKTEQICREDLQKMKNEVFKILQVIFRFRIHLNRVLYTYTKVLFLEYHLNLYTELFKLGFMQTLP